MMVRISIRLEGHHPITRVGRVHVPGIGFVVIPGTRYNQLDRHTFIPWKLEGVPKGNRFLERLVAGLVKSFEDVGINDQMRKGGCPTRKGQRSTSPRASAAGSPVDLVREQRGEEGVTRKKASKGASGDPQDVDSGGAEQRARKRHPSRLGRPVGRRRHPPRRRTPLGRRRCPRPCPSPSPSPTPPKRCGRPGARRLLSRGKNSPTCRSRHALTGLSCAKPLSLPATRRRKRGRGRLRLSC
ncbi:unnamed protein product [Ectocarpus sp. 4 AP-2014]